jgi:hypothetical protein
MTPSHINHEFRPYYIVRDNYMVWHDYAVIKLNYLFESLNKIGLVKRLDAHLISVYGSIQEQIILLLEVLTLRISHII